MLKDLTSMVLRHTRPSRRHLTPELILRLITPECPLWNATEDQLPFKDPFWGFYWPGGQATARYILDNGEIVKNRQILDLGCGCGAGAIAAAKMCAKRVLANDIDSYAVTATQINAKLNEASVKTSTNNIIGNNNIDFDTILVGDMFYDEEFANFLFQWLRRLASEGKAVLIGDPGRHGLTAKHHQHISLLATYKLPEDSCLENRGFSDTTLWMVNS
ncbi:electron transfer flavoprotein beta subunit lysine methyltransferase-like [Hyposmocoma kahamanoa]|uniref:electron transfer flavoprotein beta subunit lysine methyltransferase-like n=1 Tax=Hyposmocoma kahamanoa TaxID=1477025 RepID=UPI000E6D7868|nr:electron transfer flavoprotein beta subunit lysine methyltransferase-like [Hyposmocoma kahamanoa]XP_026315943.1 electron transfer flavoprotein beta subunit lysine methyltransferase-like [Hyposmocoma kahamanoa]